MRTIAYVGTSLDGFIAREDGDLGWLTKFENRQIRDAFRKFMKSIDAVVIGRGTFEKVLTYPFWPYTTHVFVLSTTLKRIPDHLRDKVTVLSMRPKKLMSRLSREGCSTIYVDGGRVIQRFLEDDCIDELIVTKAPVLLGSGIPLFGRLKKDIQFTHVRTTVYPNGLVRSHYRKTKPAKRLPRRNLITPQGLKT